MKQCSSTEMHTKELEQESTILTLDEWNRKNNFINIAYHDM
jgi:hypothetical protein